MTSALRTCFSALLALDAVAATVSGTVELVDSLDPAVRRHRDYSGVAVWLEPLNSSPPAIRPRTVRMIQKQKRFTPHVLAIPVGTTVDFPNLDPIFHNAFSNFSGQPFDVGLYPPGTSQKVLFRREGVVRVFCNIHPTMSAVIVVVKTPYVTVSALDGTYSFESVEPGNYRLRVFHERTTGETLLALERTLAVGDSPLTVPPLKISESGYVLVPHKNKHGKDYPPLVEDQPMYPGRKP